MATKAQNYANRRNTPNSATTPNKPPVQPNLSTNYDLIMQNKANFPDTQMNVTSLITADYENIANSKLRKNKANTNPIKANLLNDQMNVNNVNKVLTKDYENISNGTLFENKPNSKPIKANFKRPAYPEGNCFQHSMRTRKIRRLEHTPETKYMTIASSNNWKAEGL